MIRVLYIMGLYRSGSTILDIVLSNQPEMAGVGELRNLPIAGWDHGGLCACGESADECAFWGEVRREWEQKVGPNQVARLARLQDRFERIRSLPRVAPEGIFGRSASFREYGTLIQALYRAIGDVSEREVIVDSTKYPARALALLRSPGIDLRLVHLVRDGRAVIWSMVRQLNTDLQGEVLDIPREQIAPRTTRQWVLTNAASSVVAGLAGRKAIVVRYEDFVTDPERELGRIGRLADVDTTALAGRINAGDVLETSHTIAGNRVRMGGPVRLRADTEWQKKLPDEDRSTFWRKAGWLARRYGYQRS